MSSPRRSGAERAVEAVARKVLLAPRGSRLPTTQELQSSIQVGAGTVQKAFGLLEDLGALTTVARGHQGRFVERRNLGRLWRLAELPPVRAFFTPPGASEVYGLIRGLRSEFRALGVPFEVEHVRGGEARLDLARTTDCGIAIVSGGLASAHFSSAGEGLARRHLRSGSYYAAGSVVVLSGPGVNSNNPEIRIGVDPSSHDHRLISEAHYGALEERLTIPVAFPHVPRALLEGSIDTGIWHRMLLVISPELVGLTVSTLRASARQEMRDMTEAVLVFSADQPFLSAVLDAVRWDVVEGTLAATLADITIDDMDVWYR